MNFAKSLLVVLSFFTLLTGAALAARYDEGIAYQAIIPAQPTDTKDKVEVVELFWYGCPHCHRFEPFIERWLKTKSADIEFVRMPAILRPDWELHGRAFYAAEALGVLDKIHPALFTAIHAHKRKLDTEESLQAFFEEQGVSKDDFKKTFRSFAVEAKLRRARELGQRYGINGTPAVVVNGKYRLSNSICNCSFGEVLSIVDFLAEKETKAN